MLHSLNTFRFAVFTLTISLFVITGCRPPESAESQVYSAPADADSCNLQRMDEETRRGVQEQLDCVKSVVDAIGPGWLKLIAAAVEVSGAIDEAKSTVIPADEGGESVGAATPADSSTELAAVDLAETDEGSFDAFDSYDVYGSDDAFALQQINGMTVWEAFNALLDRASTGRVITPRWLERCANNAAGLSEGIRTTVAALTELSQSKSLSIEATNNLVSSVTAAMTSVLKLAQVMTTCTAGNDARGVAQFNRFVKKLTDGFSAVTNALGAVKVIAQCSMNITRGAVTLYKNTSCLIDDLKQLHESSERIRASAEQHVSRQPDLPPAQECSAMKSQMAHNLGRFCATTGRDCLSCFKDNFGAYFEATFRQCPSTGVNDYLAARDTAVQRCKLVRGE